MDEAGGGVVFAVFVAAVVLEGEGAGGGEAGELGVVDDGFAVENHGEAFAAATAPRPRVALEVLTDGIRDAFERAYFAYHLAREKGSMTRIAEKTGLERTHLYRKLKALGLTESLEVGYRLSPRGAAYLDGEG